MIENDGMRIFKRLTKQDVEFIEILQEKGGVNNEWLNRPEHYKWKEVSKRCRARGIVAPTRKNTSYWYDLTDFGFNLYQLIQSKQQEGTIIPSEPENKNKTYETTPDKNPPNTKDPFKL
jgi:hypothetical protein